MSSDGKTAAEAAREVRASFRALFAAVPGMGAALRGTNRLAVRLGFGDDGAVMRLVGFFRRRNRRQP